MFDEEDAKITFLVARIDGPTLLFAKSIVDNGEKLNKQIPTFSTLFLSFDV
jgi:hypothetical protein